MKLAVVTEWLRKHHFSQRGSKQNFAHLVGSGLLGSLVLKHVPDQPEREQMRRDYESCVRDILCAIAERNSAYFRDLADGLDALKENAPSSSLHPKLFLAHSYIYCSERGTRLPSKSEVVTMAKRFWAVARLTSCSTARPDIQYDQKFEQKIAAEIKRLPEQKWYRHFECLGLAGLPPAKPGPK